MYTRVIYTFLTQHLFPLWIHLLYTFHCIHHQKESTQDINARARALDGNSTASIFPTPCFALGLPLPSAYTLLYTKLSFQTSIFVTLLFHCIDPKHVELGKSRRAVKRRDNS